MENDSHGKSLCATMKKRASGTGPVKLSAYTLESSLVSVVSRFAPELGEVKLFQGRWYTTLLRSVRGHSGPVPQ
jgi:hypothetical protein